MMLVAKFENLLSTLLHIKLRSQNWPNWMSIFCWEHFVKDDIYSKCNWGIGDSSWKREVNILWIIQIAVFLRPEGFRNFFISTYSLVVVGGKDSLCYLDLMYNIQHARNRGSETSFGSTDRFPESIPVRSGYIFSLFLLIPSFKMSWSPLLYLPRRRQCRTPLRLSWFVSFVSEAIRWIRIWGGR